MPRSNKFKQQRLLQKLAALEPNINNTSEQEKTISYWKDSLDACIEKHSVTVANCERALAQAKETLESKSNYLKTRLQAAEKALEEKKIPQENPKQKEILLELEEIRRETLSERKARIEKYTSAPLKEKEEEYILQGILYSTGEKYDDWYNRIYGKKLSVYERGLLEEAEEEKKLAEEAEALRLKQLDEEWKKKDLEGKKEKKIRKLKS
jgi:hypothetical protein